MTLAGRMLRARASTSPSFFVPPDRPSPTIETSSKRAVTPTAAGEFPVSSLPSSEADPPLKLSTGETASTAAVDEAAPTYRENTDPCMIGGSATTVTSSGGHTTAPVCYGPTDERNTAPPSQPFEEGDEAVGIRVLDIRSGGWAGREDKCPRGTKSLRVIEDDLAASLKMGEGCLQPLAGKCAFDGCGKVCFGRDSEIWNVDLYGLQQALRV